MDLPESSELDHELRKLRNWTCMLDEVQHTTAIVQMIRETSLAQIRILMEVLRQREDELTVVYNAVPGAKSRTRELQAYCREVLTSMAEYFPVSYDWIERKRSSSPTSVSSSMTTTTTSSNTSILQYNTSLYYSIPPPSHPNVPPPRKLSALSPPFKSTIHLPPPGIPHPLPHLSPAPHSHFPKPSLHVPNSCRDSETQTSAQVHLIRLTTVAPPPTELRKKRPRKVPHYPRNESDPKWLLNWLHSLRLHKYAPKLQGLTPSELLELEDKEDVLIQRGIDSIGARRKLIVAFGEAKKQLAVDAGPRKE